MSTNLNLKLIGVLLVFVTVSLVFKADFGSQVSYAFDTLGIDVEEITEDGIDSILGHAAEELFNGGYYSYPEPTTIENKVSEDNYATITKIIDLESDYNAILIRGYEVDEYITLRYYVNTNSYNDIISTYQEKLVNAGYNEQDNTYVKDGIEFTFITKWDCIILKVKGVL